MSLSDALTVNSDGTFSLASDPGVVVGLIISPSEVIAVDAAKKTWASMLVFKAVH